MYSHNLFLKVRELLEKLSPQFGLTYKGDDAWVRCPFHGNGRESTPSCKLNLHNQKYSPGSFYCFSCSTSGNYNKFAEKLGLEKLNLQQDSRTNASYSLTQDEKIKMFDLKKEDLTEGSFPWNSKTDWRGINGKLVSQVGGVLKYNKSIDDNQLFLPCYVNGNLMGGINCNLEKKKTGNYFNTKGEWVKNSLYPYDYVKGLKPKVLFLVEGPRDALSYIQNGIPALAILGCSNWSKNNINLISILNLDRIIISLDGDAAGLKASSIIYKDLKNLYDCTILALPEGKDPADLTLTQYKKIFSKYVE